MRDGNKIQRLKCKQCDTITSDTSLRPLGNLRVSIEQAALVVGLLVEGMTIRGASRLTRLHQQTILNILEMAGEKSAALLNEKVRNVQAENVEVDELYSYVGTRPEYSGVVGYFDFGQCFQAYSGPQNK